MRQEISGVSMRRLPLCELILVFLVVVQVFTSQILVPALVDHGSAQTRYAYLEPRKKGMQRAGVNVDNV